MLLHPAAQVRRTAINEVDVFFLWPSLFETGPEGPELEDSQVEKKSKETQTGPKKLIRRTCPSDHGSAFLLRTE
jgi:hypothetical protein